MPPMFRALGQRNYRLWATADLVSVTGSWMQVLALNWLVLDRTGSAASVGLSVLLQALPALLLGSWAGALADRFPPQRVIRYAQSTHAVLALAMAALAWGDGPLSGFYLLSVLSGLVGVFDGPALGRFGSQVVGPADLGNALALGSVLNSAGRILGMSLAGVLVGVLGEPVLFLGNALSFVAVLVALARIRPELLHPLAVSPPERAGIRAGLRYLRADHRVLVLFLLGFALSSLGRNYQVTMAAMSQGPLNAGAAGYGLLSTVFAVGTVLGGLVAAQRPALTLRLLLVTAATTGMLQAVSGLSNGVFAFATLLIPIAAGAVLIDTTMSTRVQLDTAEEMRGRVLSAQGMVSAGAGAVGGPLLGWLCEDIGPAVTLHLAGAAVILATLVAWFALTRTAARPTPAPQARATAEPAPAEVAPADVAAPTPAYAATS